MKRRHVGRPPPGDGRYGSAATRRGTNAGTTRWANTARRLVHPVTTHVHDAPAAPLLHGGKEGVGELDHRTDVDVEHGANDRGRLLVEGRGVAEAGVVHQQIDGEAAPGDPFLEFDRCPASVRSSGNATAHSSPPSASAIRASRSARRATRMRRSPRARRAWAHVAPIPLDAPVTSARSCVIDPDGGPLWPALWTSGAPRGTCVHPIAQ